MKFRTVNAPLILNLLVLTFIDTDQKHPAQAS